MYSLHVLQTRPAPKVAQAPARSVRLSLTDRCDLACVYCRPHRHDGYAEKRLALDAWKAMVSGLVQAGVRRVRLTGGEPLLHPDVVEVVAHLSSLCRPRPGKAGDVPSLGLDDVALTTNATRLERLAAPLRAAGLRRVNVSLDSLDAHRFLRMTRGGNLAQVIRGIDAALAAGFDEVKLNAVVMRGENDAELEALVRWSWDRGIVPRLLEVMMIGEGARLADRVVTAAEMRATLSHLLQDDEPVKEQDRGPARYVRARHDPALRVGFISGTSDTYCAGCDRLRVSSEGTLRPCLATNDGVEAADAARGGDTAAVMQALAEAWKMKPDGETWKGCTEKTAAKVSIRAIGG